MMILFEKCGCRRDGVPKSLFISGPIGLLIFLVILLGAPGPGRGQDQENVEPFWDTVKGSYVGSYKSKSMAEEQAKGLTLRGWPAKVYEGEARGKKWWRVYMVADAKEQRASGLGGFEILPDMSGTSLRDGYSCYGRGRYETYMGLLRKINASVPGQGLMAALRVAAYDQADYHDKYTRLLWGLGRYERGSYGGGIDRIGPSASNAPLGWAMAGSDYELRSIPGKKALIVMSDFRPNRDLGKALLRARALKERYGRNLCIHTIYIGADDQGIRLARDIARAGACGNVYDGCLLIGDPSYFEGMMKNVFYGTTCPDADGDGVCDGQDACPGTPLGAPVDSRGCWVAAFAQYFDFDKDIVKNKYLPNLSQAADILRANPDTFIVVAGHTDSIGSYGYNMDLGARRANAVRKILVRYGVNPDRLKVKSYGETRPIGDNDTDKGRALNRRVEFEAWSQKPYYQDPTPPPIGPNQINRTGRP